MCKTTSIWELFSTGGGGNAALAHIFPSKPPSASNFTPAGFTVADSAPASLWGLLMSPPAVCLCFHQVKPKESSVCVGALLFLYTGDFYLNIKFQDDSAGRELPLAWFMLPSVHIRTLDTPLQAGAWRATGLVVFSSVWRIDSSDVDVLCKYTHVNMIM